MGEQLQVADSRFLCWGVLVVWFTGLNLCCGVLQSKCNVCGWVDVERTGRDRER